MSFRAVDAFPILLEAGAGTQEGQARLVRGQESPAARFGFSSFAIPRYPGEIKSLYELQESSRKELAARP